MPLAAILLLLVPGRCLPQALAPYEPPSGCYVGAYIELDPVVKDDIARFEQLTGKKHASYFRYVGYGQPFPFAWANRLKALGAMPHIAWEPNEGLGKVQDDAYLQGWAQACAYYREPIFLRFASEMNGDWEAWSGDPDRYIAKWRLVCNVMRRVAPNVIMVWCPFATPKSTIPLYYPGDEYVDWVGLNVYSVVVHEGNINKRAVENAVQHLEFIYNLYSSRKPIAVCEYAATHFCQATNGETVDFAVREMRRMYEAIQLRFPRVRMINWFSVDTVEEGLAHNDYSLTTNATVLATYRSLVSSGYFLSKVVGSRPAAVAAVGPAVALPGTAVAPGAWVTEPPTSPALPPPAASQPTLVSPPSVPSGPTSGATPLTLPVGPAAPQDLAAPEVPVTSVPLALAGQASPPPGAIAIVVHGGEPAALRGQVTVEAVLGSALAPDRVVFELDGRFRAVTSGAPHAFPWNASLSSPGEHRIRATARDALGSTLAEAEAAVVVTDRH